MVRKGRPGSCCTRILVVEACSFETKTSERQDFLVLKLLLPPLGRKRVPHKQGQDVRELDVLLPLLRERVPQKQRQEQDGEKARKEAEILVDAAVASHHRKTSRKFP
jgi:hypothetical protein